MRDLSGRVRPDRERPAQEIGDRAVSAVGVVRRAARPRDPRAERSRVGKQLVHEARFAEPGLADDRDDVSLAGESFLERAHEHGDLIVAPTERRAAAIRRRCLDSEEPPGNERRGLALGCDRRMRFVCEETRCEPIRGVADQDFARLRGLLEARRDVDCVAEYAELALLVPDRPRDRETGVDPDPQGEVAPGPLGDAFVLMIERAEDRERGPLSARRMIDLVMDRAEHRDDSVTDVLLDQSARRANLQSDRVPRGAHVLVKLFRTEALSECGESRDVREENRDLLGLALDRLHRDEPRAAVSAVAERDGHLARAFRTGDGRSPHQPPRLRPLTCHSGVGEVC